MKKKHKSKASDSSDSESDSDKKKKKQSSILDKAKIATGVIAGGAIIKKYTDSKAETVVDKNKLKTGESTLDVTIIVRQWFEQLTLDVSQASKKSGSNASAEIEIIVEKATSSITETLRLISVNAHKSVTDTTTVQQYRNSIEWVKNLVIQSSYQIKTIGINSALSSSNTGGIEQMRPIAVAIQEQVNVEIRRYKLSVESTSVSKKTEVTAIEHKKNDNVVCTGHKAALNRKEYCDRLEKHVSTTITETQTLVISWFAQVVRNISICIHEGGNVKQNVAVIIEKSKAELDSTIKSTQHKFTSSIDVYEEDKTFALIQSQLNESLKKVQTTVDSKLVEIQETIVKTHSETEVTEKLSVLFESSKVQITEVFESSCKKSTTVIKEETVQTDSTVQIIESVDSVKTVISQWHTKLTEEIHTISTSTTITNKEERIQLLIKQATIEIDRVTLEAKEKISKCSSVKKISKSKEQDLISSIDYAKETFTSDIVKIQKSTVESIKHTETDIKESVSTAVKTSHDKINGYLTGATAAVVGAATAAIAVHAVNKHEKEEEKKEETHGKQSVDLQDNVSVISKWFELYVKRISDSVHHNETDVVQHVTVISEHAEQEISEIITTARQDFIKRLSHESLDQESYNYACKHYEESLETVRVSVISQVSEVKKIAIQAHTTGNTHTLDSELTKLTTISHETIKTAMSSSVVISHQTQEVTSNTGKATTGSIVQVEVKEDEEVLGEEEVEFERKEHTVSSQKIEKLEQKTDKGELTCLYILKH